MSDQTESDWKGFNLLLQPDLDGEIERQLDYGDSKAAWIREACRMRLASDRGNDNTEQ